MVDGRRSSIEKLLMHLGNGITHLHPDDLAQFVTRATSMVDGEDTTVLLVDLGQEQLRGLGDGPDDRSFPVDGPGPGLAYRSEQIVVEGTTGGRTQLWVPILDSAERLGVLGVTVASGADDLELWSALASLVGEALVSKGSYGDGVMRTRRADQLSLAAEMRWATLPPLTFTGARVQVSGVLEPAYDIAGDAFDYALNDHEVLLAVIDAVGHGLEASQIANLAIAEYRHSRHRHEDKGALVRSIDQVVADQFGDSRFITGQFASLDLDRGVLEIINAGHPRPVLFRSGRDVGDVQCQPNRPLGLGLVRTGVGTISLEPGDVVLFHTDGVTEARSAADQDYGRHGLVAAVEAALRDDERPAEVLRRVVRDVRQHTQTRLRDDATMVFLRWH